MGIVFFDLETQNSIDEVGGRGNLRALKMSVGVTYADGAFHRYTETNAAELFAELKSAAVVVGFNLLNFDYEVLRAYTPDDLRVPDPATQKPRRNVMIVVFTDEAGDDQDGLEPTVMECRR